jgi:hypothetical protein
MKTQECYVMSIQYLQDVICINGHLTSLQEKHRILKMNFEWIFDFLFNILQMIPRKNPCRIQCYKSSNHHK